MAQLGYVWEHNKPGRGERVDIELVDKQLCLCCPHPDMWIQLELTKADKVYLLRQLMKDFLK